MAHLDKMVYRILNSKQKNGGLKFTETGFTKLESVIKLLEGKYLLNDVVHFVETDSKKQFILKKIAGQAHISINRLPRLLTKILRHQAKSLGLIVKPDGYMELDCIFDVCVQLFNVDKDQLTIENIRGIVERDSKSRFSMITIGSINYIRANQGHTMKIDPNKLLKKITSPSQIDRCLHGTYIKCIDLIKTHGLSRMRRDQIHMTNQLPESCKAKSGMRQNVEIIIEINLPLAMEEGLEFFLSKNGVILCPGNKDGIILPRYFKDVVYR